MNTRDVSQTALVPGLDAVLKEIDISRIWAHMEYFNTFEKLSGKPEALKFTDYAAAYLDKEQIPYTMERFDAFLSNPVESFLEAGGEEIPSRPRSFGACCPEGVRAPLVYDPYNRSGGGTELEKQQLYRTFAGKIVLSHGFDERYAKIAEANGALAWIQVWESDDPDIHEDTVSPVWGTPDLDSRFFRLRIPVIAITWASGERLIRMLKERDGQMEVFLRSVTEETVSQVVLPVAQIPGRSEDFVLLSDHYDTWYIGAFDNGTANAASLELARVFWKHRDQMERSLRIAWWPGHSNGRYMGSAWYCDHHWDDLYHRCVASLNSDLIGARDSDTLFIRTTGFEGRAFLTDIARAAAPGAPVRFGRIGRGADQSFFGCGIPYHINPRLEMDPDRRTTTSPGGHPWWHTADDLLKHVDRQVLETDARILGAFTWAFLASPHLPGQPGEYFASFLQDLEHLRRFPEYETGLDQLIQAVRRTEKQFEALLAEAENRPRLRLAAIRLAAGTINRLRQSSGSPYEPDTAFAYGPLHLLGDSCRYGKEECPPELHLFARTTFIRQRNRFLTELELLNARMDQLIRQKEEYPYEP